MTTVPRPTRPGICRRPAGRCLPPSLLALALLALTPITALADVLAPPMTARVAETPYPGPPEAIGSAANGCLSGGQALPISGPGWETLRPERNRFWGHPALIAFFTEKAQETKDLGTLLVADIAQPRGGHMTSGHGSHQTGLDMDVLFRLAQHPLTDQERRDPDLDGVVAEDGSLKPDAWGAAQMAVLKVFASDPRVERIFVNPMIKLSLCLQVTGERGWLRTLRPWWGHQEHFHVRISCPAGDRACIPGPPLPPGDGCGNELQSWITTGDWKSRPHPAIPSQHVYRPEMPAACRPILSAQ